MDRLSPLFAHAPVTARVFYSGNLCHLAPVDNQDGDGHLHLLRQGTLKISGSDGSGDLVTGPCLVVLPHGGTHQLTPLDAVVGVDLICAVVGWGAQTRETIVAGMPNLVIVPLDVVSAAGRVVELMFDEAFSDHSGRDAALNRLTEYLLVLLLRHLIASESVGIGALAALADPQLANVVTKIHLHPNREWTLELLAEQAQMSRSRFAAHFRNTTGTTPLGYLTAWRITVAKGQLQRGRPLKAIAISVGYRNATTFARAFLRVTGQSPREWVDSAKPTEH
jgi:AraC-like DNA-binding protein